MIDVPRVRYMYDLTKCLFIIIIIRSLYKKDSVVIADIVVVCLFVCMFLCVFIYSLRLFIIVYALRLTVVINLFLSYLISSYIIYLKISNIHAQRHCIVRTVTTIQE